MEYEITEVELTGYNGERSRRIVTYIQRRFRTVPFCPNLQDKRGVKLQDEWLRMFNEADNDRYNQSPMLNRITGCAKSILWTNIKFKYTYG